MPANTLTNALFNLLESAAFGEAEAMDDFAKILGHLDDTYGPSAEREDPKILMARTSEEAGYLGADPFIEVKLGWPDGSDAVVHVHITNHRPRTWR